MMPLSGADEVIHGGFTTWRKAQTTRHLRNQSFTPREMSMENSAGTVPSSKLENATSKVSDALSSGSKRVQSMGKQGLDAITDMTSQARDVAADAGDSIVAYTKKNPVKALTIAATAGALLYAAIKALAPDSSGSR
jgi:ElaB/YqjD/DUF883 family membrane-anchored ribosome-binding protein